MSSQTKKHHRERTGQSSGQQAPKGETEAQEVVLESATTAQVPLPSEALELIRKIETLRNSRVITFFANPNVMVRDDVPLQIYHQLRKVGKVPRIDLFLHSTGGQTEVPWRIITLIRNFCEHFGVLIPFMAYSAATHIAMGANEIVMGDMSELTPVDPSRSHPLLPKDGDTSLMISVQDLRHCIEFLKRDNVPYTPESLATIYTALFEKVHPLALGAIEQAYALARLVSQKALSTHFDPERDKERIERIVNAFSEKFFSHNYRIGWREAKEAGLDITYTDADLWEMMWQLFNHYAAYGMAVRPISEKPIHIGKPIVWIDTTAERRILEETYLVRVEKETGAQRGERVIAQWLAQKWEEQSSENKQNAPNEGQGE